MGTARITRNVELIPILQYQLECNRRERLKALWSIFRVFPIRLFLHSWALLCTLCLAYLSQRACSSWHNAAEKCPFH